MKHATDWHKEEVSYEIERLRAILRNPNATEEEKRVAGDMLAHMAEEVKKIKSERKP